jgi:hypothetical protein
MAVRHPAAGVLPGATPDQHTGVDSRREPGRGVTLKAGHLQARVPRRNDDEHRTGMDNDVTSNR